jgi:transcriptional regulatory protein LevR
VSNFENKKFLVHPSQAESTGCKEVVTSCCSGYGRNKKARNIWVPKASQNFRSKDNVHTSFITICQSSKRNKVVIKRKNMVSLPEVGQTIKPKD